MSSRPIRVTLVSHYFAAHRGGVEAVAFELARRLAASGAAEIEWHASGTDAPPADAPGLRCVPARACNFLERHAGFPYPLWFPSALRVLGRAIRECDVVHLHDSVYLPTALAARMAARAGKPVLVTQHVGMVPYRNPLLRGLLQGANRVVGARVLGRAAQVAFVSDTVRQYFKSFVGFRAEPHYIPNGVDTQLFSPAEPGRQQVPTLLFVGRFVEKKGLHVLRELAARLPRARFVLAGWGPIDPEAWSLPNVTVRRNLDQHGLAPLYRAADLLVLPSVGEGFPLVVQEAMACGTPALVGTETAAGAPEAGELLLAEPVGDAGTAARWAARIEALLGAPAVLQGLRPRVAALARQHWSWERTAARYAELLASLSSSTR